MAEYFHRKWSGLQAAVWLQAGVSMLNVEGLCTAVQGNCHLSDARHAREYTMCVYLMKMREYFRWERRLPLTAGLPLSELGDWVVAREQLWESLEGDDFACLPLGAGCHDPFDADEVNRWLVPQGLVYSAGYGRFVKPHFFLARLLRRERRDGLDVYVSTDEYARDLAAPPAMLRGESIFVRRESLRRTLWERVEDWRWRQRPDNAMGRAVASYPFATDPEAALDQMTEDEVEPIILHELGEGRAGRELGEGWPEMLVAMAHSRAEMPLRAVRDLTADCLVTLPTLLESGSDASLHLHFSNFRAHRLEMFPRLQSAYREWVIHGRRSALRAAVDAGRDHWLQTARGVLGLYAGAPEIEPDRLVDYLDGRRLI
jgi:hypothetical protein